MKKLIYLSIVFIGLLVFPISNVNAQGVGINPSGNNPDPSAMFDVSSTTKGTLITRMTTAQRNAISNPAQSLLIFNTTTRCFEYWESGLWQIMTCACTPVAASVSISANPSGTICSGTNVTFSATPVNGGTTPSYQWQINGSNVGTNSSTYSSATLVNGNIITCLMTSNAPCVIGSPATSNQITMMVSAPPTAANAGTDINPSCGVSTATLAGNTPSVGTGNWSVLSGTATITTPSSPTSGVTGLAVPGTATLRWTISNSPCTASTDDVVITTTACITCPASLTISHTINVNGAPETKTVTYGVVKTNLTGADKCWITRNLGATSQATSGSDATDAAAGWYWQFNRKQGYKVNPLSPAWTITSITETTDWLAANDPCTIMLGAGWRIPTSVEWSNADANGPWDSYTDTYNSVLRIHAAGYLRNSDGVLFERGTNGYYWSSTQFSSTNGSILYFHSGNSFIANDNNADGLAVRCLRD